MSLDDIIAVRVNNGRFGVFKLFLRENPFLLQFGEGKHAQQYGVPEFPGFGIMQRNMVAE